MYLQPYLNQPPELSELGSINKSSWKMLNIGAFIKGKGFGDDDDDDDDYYYYFSPQVEG